MDRTGIDWEDAFANADYIPNGAAFPAAWQAKATEFRAQHANAQIDEPYGADPRERFDLFLPRTTARGVVVFVHGGYWLRFDKSYWSHLAAGPLARGMAVAMPSYTLAPEASIAQITDQIAAAIDKIAAKVAGPIRLTGHSAGGHLVSRQICEDSGITPEVQARIDRVVSISGVHDLRPLQHHSMNTQFKLTPETAAQNSPVCHDAMHDKVFVSMVGGDERPEFLRQSAVLYEKWRAQISARQIVVEGRHHFDVIDALGDPQSELTEILSS